MNTPQRDYLRLPSRPTLLQIKIDVCRKHGVTMNELMSRRRHKRIAWARMEGYWRAREETSASFPEIARAFNRGDHTTVMSGAKKHAERLAKNSQHDSVIHNASGDATEEMRSL